MPCSTDVGQRGRGSKNRTWESLSGKREGPPVMGTAIRSWFIYLDSKW